MSNQKHGKYLACPTCGCDNSVKDSRAWADNSAIKRRRHCPNGHRFTTIEVCLPDEAVVLRPGTGERPPEVVTLRSYAARVAQAATQAVQHWLA